MNRPYNQPKSIASGLAGFFVSGNHDIDGFWGIGVVYSEATVVGVNSVSTNLPGSEVIAPIGFRRI